MNSKNCRVNSKKMCKKPFMDISMIVQIDSYLCILLGKCIQIVCIDTNVHFRHGMNEFYTKEREGERKKERERYTNRVHDKYKCIFMMAVIKK